MENAKANSIKQFSVCSEDQCSFFDQVERLSPGNDNTPIHRFFTLMRKMGAHSFVEEDLELNSELIYEKMAAETRCGGSVNLEAIRLTFFKNWPKTGDWKDDSLNDETILGYAVITTFNLPNPKDKRINLHEAVVGIPFIDGMGPSKSMKIPLMNYYFHCVREHKTCVGSTSLGIKNYKLIGSFFAQQNDLTNVCAHACLRMAINSAPWIKEKITNEYINKFLNIDLTKRKLGHLGGEDQSVDSGLSLDEITSVVKSFNVNVMEFNFSRNLEIDYDHYLYPFIESRCPVILGVEGWHIKDGDSIGHVVTVVGHTMNSDRWEPKAHKMYGGYPITGYINAASYTDHFIINDDNLGIYGTLPTEVLRNVIVPAKNPNLHAAMAVVIVPDEVSVTGYEAEQVAVTTFKSNILSGNITLSSKWNERMINEINTSDIVARTILQEKSEYVDYCEKFIIGPGKMIDPKEKKEILENFPKYIWVTEISFPDIYTGNKHKIADVLVDAVKNDGSSLYDNFIDVIIPHEAGHVDLIRNVGEPEATDW